MRRNFYILSFILAVLLFVSCEKEDMKPLDNAAYIRAFQGQTNFGLGEGPMGAVGIPTGNPKLYFIIDGDFTRQDQHPFGASSAEALWPRSNFQAGFYRYSGTSTTEFPGNKTFNPVGPSINKADLSAWMQIEPGKHRFTFLRYDESQKPFRYKKESIVLDTILELSAGQYYTLQSISSDLDDHTKYQLQVLRENMSHDFNDSTKIYLSFFSSMTDPSALEETEVDIYHSYWYVQYLNPGVLNSRYREVISPEEFVATLNTNLSQGSDNQTAWVDLDYPAMFYNITPAGEIRRKPFSVFTIYKKGENKAKGNTPLLQWNSFYNGSPFNFGLPELLGGDIRRIQLCNFKYYSWGMPVSDVRFYAHGIKRMSGN
ncbi:hypothetical protein [Pedobacter sp. SYSU D00535]|uniref:hypothetical protein n=1 Tax=Pedobacter sp. SYSU D00535 TaxID=2810308 RepID=UPI001A973C05|nr:hypothetical protein [Pedobacter sp. SYSU D00535]